MSTAGEKKRKVVVLGASPKPERASYQAVNMLAERGFEVVPIGMQSGQIGDIELVTGLPQLEHVDTVSIYLHASRQESLESYLTQLKPRKIIWNPGAENPSLERTMRQQGIEIDRACTLVLVATGQL